MIYEYDFEIIPMPEGDRRMVEMGFGEVEKLCPIIRDLLNKRAKDGWEPYYPFPVPMLWFKRVAKKSKKN